MSGIRPELSIWVVSNRWLEIDRRPFYGEAISNPRGGGGLQGHRALLASGKVVPLRYFPKSPVKKDYVLFPQGFVSSDDAVELILGTSQHS
jgi:hypothetical protein